MRLEEYLEALQKCPDEQLTDELGIFDNWPIFLNADFGHVVEHLEGSGKYEHEDTTFEEGLGIRHLFNYKPGTVKLQVFNWVALMSTTGLGTGKLGNRKKDRLVIESERQLRDYNMTIMLHPYQDRQIAGVHPLRALAMVVDDIGQFATRDNIPLCMPNTIGWKYAGAKDYSKIVYHEPKTSVSSQK